MDEETNKIRQQIDIERDQLGRNLDEIEDRVKSATDLKAHFNKNTGLVLGAAVAGGFLLSLALRKSSRSDRTWNGESDSERERSASTATPSTRPASRHIRRVTETIDNIFEGLVAVASDKLQSVVANAVPGFQTQSDTLDRQRGRSSVHQMKPDLGNPSEFSAVK
jgi:hypothetical protein